MASYLLFRLRGPMQSWGGASAVGENRLSASHPSHSGVMGLLAAALGIRREQSEALDALHRSLFFAVRQDKVGGIMTDYHTVQSAKNMSKRLFFTRREEVKTKIDKLESLETTLSSRVYLTDAAFTVCIWQAEENNFVTLDALRDALVKPRSMLYLGRKSCPLSCPLVPLIEEAPHVAEAFQLYTQRYSDVTKEPLPVRSVAIWTDAGHGMDMDTHILCRVKDRLTCAVRRQYGMRNEYCSTISPLGIVSDVPIDAISDAPLDEVQDAFDEVFDQGGTDYVHE